MGTRGICALAALLVSSVAAADDEPAVSARVLPTGEVEVECFDCPPAQAPEVALHGAGVRVPATRVLSYAQARGPIAVAFVINTQALFMVTDDDPTDCEPWEGAIDRIANAFQLARFGDRIPGSTAMIVGYDTAARIITPLGPIERLDANVFGSSADYRGRGGNDLIVGVGLALVELERAQAVKKVMIVIGDGNDAGQDVGTTTRLRELGERAHQKGVAIFAVIWKNAISLQGQVIDHLTKQIVTVRGDGIAGAIIDPLERLQRHQYFQFSPETLPHDGLPHEYTLRIDERSLPSVTVALAAPLPREANRSGWLYLAIAIGIGLALVSWRTIG
jgi:hypothetical protein